jgi:hypothetical protein
VCAGAHWDINWQTNKGCTQLHLLLAAFPPPRDDSPTYRKLLKSCMDGGLDVGAQEERGRSALFILCEQMATVGSDTCPDAARLVHLLLGGGNASHSASAARKIVNSADRTGRTVFDIVERADHSCLAACRAVLRDASQGVLHQDGASYVISAAQSGAHGSRRPGIAGSSSVSGAGDWELDRPRTTSALIARVSQMSGSGSAGNLGSYTARGEAETKRKTSVSYSSTTAVNTSSSRHQQAGSSSYLHEEYEADAAPIPLLRGGASDHASGAAPSYGSSYYSPAVAPRRNPRPSYDDSA